jgi:hypothetical protein
VVGDFNGDGNLDLAVADLEANSVSVLLGDGTGHFGPTSFIPKPVAVGSGPTSIAVGDFNSDGKLDLAVTNANDNTVTILLGNGDGTFTEAANSPVLTYQVRPVSVKAGDFNGDGKLDLAVANATSSSVTILVGQGNGTFTTQPPVHFPAGRFPTSIALADFNKDGKLDIAVADRSSNMVSILLGDGTGSFASGRHFAVDNDPLSVAVADFNGDGLPDLVVANLLSSRVWVLLNATDTVPPVTTATPSPAPNASGWNDSSVNVTLHATDNEPGSSGVQEIHYTIGATPQVVASGDTTVLNVTAEGVLSISYYALDKAGNAEAPHSLTLRIDKTPPILTMPTLASSYTFNAQLTITFAATDALSGIAKAQAVLNGTPISNGSTVTLNQPGTNTFTLTATDVAGNTATATATFSVFYHFIGFLAPVSNDGSSVFKLGSTVPLKFPLTDSTGASVSTAVATLTVQMLSGGTPVGTPIDATPSGNADTGNVFRYDSTSNQYIYNLGTMMLSTGVWQLQVHLDDGTIRTVVMGTR